MEVIVLTALIRKGADILGILAQEQGSRLYWLEEDVGWIQREMGHMKSFLTDFDIRRTNSQGLAYLKKIIRELAHDVEDIMDSHFSTYLTRGKRKRFIYAAGANSRLSMEIKGIRRRIEDIKSARATYGITEDPSTSNDGQHFNDHRRRLLVHVDDHWTIGLDTKVKKLTCRLLNPGLLLDVISIVGPPGVGKSTLAKLMFKSSQLYFDCAAFVCISQKPKYEEVLQDLARQVGLGKKLKRNLESNLFQYLSKKKFLITFDDIWYSHSWDSLMGIIPLTSSNGSRVIVTSRDSSVGKYAGKKVMRMQPLNEMESQKLFYKLVMTSSKETTLPPVLEQIAVQILRKCGGLPLAIVSSARLLASRERSEEAWLELLKNFMGENNADDDWWEIVAQSYHALPNNVKPCFLTFGLFPKDYHITAFELISLWLAEKFIKEEDVGIQYLNILVSRNLVEVVCRGCDGKIQKCKIHIFLHHLCVKLSKDNDFFQEMNYLGSYSTEQVRRITIQYQAIGNHVYMKQVKQHSVKCRTLLWFDVCHTFNKRHTKEILGDLKYLRFLILEFQILESRLPDEIGSLCHLSYLRLTGYADSALPQSIRNLKKLTTFDVKDCKHIRLPMCIWQMKELKHLFLNGNIIVSHCLKQLGPQILSFCRPFDTFLPNLWTLDAEDGCNLKSSWLTHLTSIRKLRIRNPTDQTIKLLSSMPMSYELENLRLGWRKDRLTERLHLSYHHNLVKLNLSIPMTKLPEAGDFPPNLIKLTLLWTELEEDPMEVLKMLPKLRILKMLRNCYVGRSLVIAGKNGFPQLEFLQLDGLWPLEEVVCESGMPKLKRVIFENCSALKSISKKFQVAMQKCKSYDVMT